MVQVFGPAKGRRRYSNVDVHDDKVLDRIRELYLVVYGKPTMPKSKLLGKEFAKGIAAKVVKGILFSWASFGHETNTNQQRKWQSKLDILIAKKASLLGTNVVQVKKELKVVDIVKVEKDVK
jgi:hypothetical protein